MGNRGFFGFSNPQPPKLMVVRSVLASNKSVTTLATVLSVSFTLPKTTVVTITVDASAVHTGGNHTTLSTIILDYTTQLGLEIGISQINNYGIACPRTYSLSLDSGDHTIEFKARADANTTTFYANSELQVTYMI
jgi:hypothetical protein